MANGFAEQLTNISNAVSAASRRRIVRSMRAYASVYAHGEQAFLARLSKAKAANGARLLCLADVEALRLQRDQCAEQCPSSSWSGFLRGAPAIQCALCP